MRIVAGSLRGRTVDAPAGEGTRPTTDRVREALFSSLYSLRGGFEGARVLDAFAGSGALGIEALSRGAAHACLYENGKAAVRVLQRNLAGCGLGPDRVQLVAKDVLAQPPLSARPAFDLVFLDPPYAYAAEKVASFAAALRDAGALAPDAIVVYEHALEFAGQVRQACERAGLAVHAQKKYGKTGVTFAFAAAGDAREHDAGIGAETPASGPDAHEAAESEGRA